MKKLFVTLCVALLPGLALAEADGPDYWQVHGVAADDVLNIRAEANPHADKVGEIPPGGRCVANLGCTGGLTLEESMTLSEHERKAVAKKRPRWCKVQYRGTEGWVSGHYLREGACSSGYAD